MKAHPPHPCKNCGIYHTHYLVQVEQQSKPGVEHE